jgi:hypothetical protein
MVHRIFKNMVLRTNCKNIELDLLKRYTTLFAIRHLIDGGVDIRISKSNQGFVNISQDFKKLFSDWFITKANNFIQLDQEDIDIEGYYRLLFFFFSCHYYFKYYTHPYNKLLK